MASLLRTYTLVVFLLVFGLMRLTIGVSTPTPVLTINSPDGDVIDCIKREEQLAFSHPLLKDHKLQEFPTGMARSESEVEEPLQVWRTTGLTCPRGTIPVRRNLYKKTVSHTKYPKVHEVIPTATVGHKYAIGFIQNQGKIYGTRATLNIWDPIVQEGVDAFSLAQIWLVSGSYMTSDITTVEAGWQVYPSRYLDNQSRLFTYWTRDAYNITGCYNTECGGFVQTSNTIAVGAAISPTSTPKGTQLDITIQIWKDQFTGNWWLGLGLNVVPVGYWPTTIVPLMSEYAHRVQWGGEVFDRNLSGVSSNVQMGSGKFADEGYREAAYICNIKVAEDNHTFEPVQNFGVQAEYPEFYTIKKRYNKQCGNHFYFGGPGPLRSRAVRGTATHISRVFFFSILYLAFFFLLI